ncbi:MAG: NAD(P)/FAD-dependent oxidoreductase [Dehalococcoidia bacterium]|nr:NAD(P)/FAD-dependent oxidoreductase [Dehalococcoidia bacterium]
MSRPHTSSSPGGGRCPRRDAPPMTAGALDVEVAVVGAGVVGLAIAQRLAREGRTVAVIERHEGMARESSSHNSGVVHAAIYYERGSLKHRLCWEGNARTYEWCEAHGVAVRRTGKLIVALAEEERGGLDALYRQAAANAVRGLQRLTAAEARAFEPHVPAVEAIWSPSTGVVDAFALARSYEAEARAHGALIVYRHELAGAERVAGGFALSLRDGGGARPGLRCAALVNSAGLRAPEVAALLGYPLDGGAYADVAVPVLRQAVNRGRYYDIVDAAAARLVSRPVYPLPEHRAGGLGLHLTVDTDGGAHLGPSAEWLDDGALLDYRHPDDGWRAEFLRCGRRLLPALRDDQIAPGQVGYRPKLQRPGEEQADFLLWHDRGYVHLGGIESPGLTASLPLADEVAAVLR